jgi:hypothetical protein
MYYGGRSVLITDLNISMEIPGQYGRVFFLSRITRIVQNCEYDGSLITDYTDCTESGVCGSMYHGLHGLYRIGSMWEVYITDYADCTEL